jgi:serine/threonine protein kinase
VNEQTHAPSDPSDPVLSPGEEVSAGYIVRSHLNRGDVLDVYTVDSLERAVLCTAKRLRPSRCDDAAERRQLLTEGRLLMRFTHPHLVRAYEIAEADTGPVVIMETLTGATVSRLILDHGRLGEEDAVVLADQLVSLLHYLHGQGVLHLDLKPSNIIATGGSARVIDLNLTRPIGTSGLMAGTHEYKAPEQITGDELTEATDVWGLGGVMFRALTGHRPFAREQGERGPDLRPEMEELSAISPELRRLVEQCFARNPTDRPSIDDLRSELTAIAGAFE